MARDDRDRLDLPRDPRRGLPRPHYDPEAFGRFSEAIARFIGTARFLVIQTFIVIGWVLWNLFITEKLRFDNYPFIFLTLVLSLQAAYAAPLILLAQNRQADRDRVNLEEDRSQYARALADTDYLTREVASIRLSIGDVATRDFIRSELGRVVHDLQGPAPGKAKGKAKRRDRSSTSDTDPAPPAASSGSAAATATPSLDDPAAEQPQSGPAPTPFPAPIEDQPYSQ
ncbi:MAG TPA: DUF1003 domain-containing protein [Mycobacteriales bacterium]|nr:DUF1003 domain-containing protein [Mycobacteriales bacterium]